VSSGENKGFIRGQKYPEIAAPGKDPESWARLIQKIYPVKFSLPSFA
jgi:hypothetical protein